MTQVLTIPTPFADLSELTENFSQRVDEERLMLPHSEPMAEGEWVQFNVLLGDGAPALAGVGRVQGSYDNGEEHPPEYRFDVVLDSLQFEGMNEVMFERLLVARSTSMGGEPVTGEVAVDELDRRSAEAAPEPAPPSEWSDEEAWQGATAASVAGSPENAGSLPLGEAFGTEPTDSLESASLDTGSIDAGAIESSPSAFDTGSLEPSADEARMEVDTGDVALVPAEPPPPEPVRARPSGSPPPVARRASKRPPAAPYPTRPLELGRLPSPHAFDGRALTRASLTPVWSPAPEPRPEPAQSSGLFDYQGGVPRPAHPPRPDLDPSLRVVPAPRPGAPWPRAVVAAATAVAIASGPAFADAPESGVDLAAEGESEEW